MPPMLPSLKAKMTLAVSLLVAAILVLSALATFSYFRRELTKTISQEQATLVADIAEHLDDTLITNRHLLVTMARLLGPDIIRSPSSAQTLLEREEHARLLFDTLVLISPDKKVMAAVPTAAGSAATDFSRLNCVDTVLHSRQPIICGPESLTSEHPAVALAVPIVGRDGRLSGLLAGTYYLTERNFLGKLSQVRIGKSGRLTISAADGTVIMSTDRSLLLKKLPAASTDSLTSSRTLTSVGWTVTASYPLSDAFAPIDRARWYFSIGLVMMTVVAITFVRLVMGHLTAPLVRFARHVEEMPEKQGKRKLIAIRSGDEIETLSESFNKMVAEMERQRDDIQRNEELLRTVALFTAQFAFVRDTSGTIGFISPNCERITGYEDTEFCAYPDLLDRLIMEEDREKWTRCKGSLVAGRANATLDLRIVTREGRTRWMSAACESIVDETGSVTGFRGNFSDITERKLAEEALRDSNEMMDAVLAAAPFAIVAVDADLKVTLWNAAAENIFGWRRDEIIGRPYPLVRPENEQELFDLRQIVRKGSRLNSMRVRRRNRRGEPVDLLVFAAPLRQKEGAPPRSVAILVPSDGDMERTA